MKLDLPFLLWIGTVYRLDNKDLYMSFDRFLFAIESRDLSQADKSSIIVSSIPKLFLNNKIYSYTKKNYLALGNLNLSFKNFQDWKVNVFLSFFGEW